MQKINVAVVGCGFVANGHLNAWRKVDQAQVVAVSDLNETLAQSTAQSWKIPHYYKSLSELMEHDEVDLVDICTPPQVHAALAVQAMKAGSNVLIEKPMTMTVKDAQEIVKCQKDSNLKAGVIHNWLFEPPMLEAIGLVEKGRLGEVYRMDVDAVNTKHDSMAANERHWSHGFPGGRFSEMLAHPIYLMSHFLGQVELSDVQVSKIGDYHWMKSDELCATFKSGNKLGRAYASFNAPRDAIFVNLYGKEAILRLEMITATVNIFPGRKTDSGRFSKGFDSLRRAGQLIKATAKNAAKIMSGSWLSGHDLYIKLFTENIIRGGDAPVTVEQGARAIEVLEQTCNRIEQIETTRGTSTGN